MKLFTKDFTLMVIGQIISLFGNAVLRLALPLYLLRETNSSAVYGAVTACSFIPMVFFSLFGGVIADRVNKRNIMVMLDFCTAIIIAIFSFMLEKLSLIPLMIVTLMLLYGISGAYQPSVQASIPLLVDEKLLIKANAIINMVGTLSGLLGPIIGGVLFGAFGIIPILFISIICFLVSAVIEIFIKIPHQQKSSEQKGILKTVGNDLKESYGFVRNDKPVFLSVLWLLALFNLVMSAALLVGIPVVIVQILKMSDTALGIAQGMMGLGGISGGIIAGAFGKKIKLKDSYIMLIVCSFTTFLMGISLFSGISDIISFAVIATMSFSAMCSSTMFSVAMLTAVQQQTPPHLLGKIMALIMAVSSCSQPIGQAIYGVLFDLFSNQVHIVMIVSAVLAFMIAVFSRKIFVKLQYD